MFRIEIDYTFYSLTHYLASDWLKEKRNSVQPTVSSLPAANS